MRARSVTLALLLVALPVLAAGCVKPPESQEVRAGTCTEAAYGWMRWLTPVDMGNASRTLQETGFSVREFRPEGFNDTWLVFRPTEAGSDAAAGGTWNSTQRNFRGVLRVFSQVTGDPGNATDPQGGEGWRNQTFMSVVYDPVRGFDPVNVPSTVQQVQLRDFMEVLNQTVVNRIAPVGGPDTVFVDRRTVCPSAADPDDELGLDLTPEGEYV